MRSCIMCLAPPYGLELARLLERHAIVNCPIVPFRMIFPQQNVPVIYYLLHGSRNECPDAVTTFFINRPNRPKPILAFKRRFLIHWYGLTSANDLPFLLIDVDRIKLVRSLVTIRRGFRSATPATSVSVLPFFV